MSGLAKVEWITETGMHKVIGTLEDCAKLLEILQSVVDDTESSVIESVMTTQIL